jgi:putative glutamine amidotransferase
MEEYMSIVLVSAHYDSEGTKNPYPHISSHYCAAVAARGSVPVIASCAPAEMQAAACDALLLTGGGDLDAEYYAYRNPALIRGANRARDRHEIELFWAFYNAKKPIFGICRGMQLINILLGGTLWEDIPSERGSSIHSGGKTHNIEVRAESKLYEIMGSGGTVNSYHHQSCCDVAPGFSVDAVAEDGVIEAISDETRGIYGVQWHPERGEAAQLKIEN